METFEIRLIAFLHYDMGTRLWEPGRKMWWFEKEIYSLINLNAWSSGNGTLERCGLVGKSVSLEIGFWWFKTLKPKLVSLSFFQLPVIADVKLATASAALCLLACCHAYCYDENELTL